MSREPSLSAPATVLVVLAVVFGVLVVVRGALTGVTDGVTVAAVVVLGCTAIGLAVSGGAGR